jgi:hypothetical protein
MSYGYKIEERQRIPSLFKTYTLENQELAKHLWVGIIVKLRVSFEEDICLVCAYIQCLSIV